MTENEEEFQESFGEFLKRHREASGKSIEEIARVTRISKRYLLSFEANDLDGLPEKAFAKGFLKNYATEVGMDSEECLRRFDQLVAASAPTQIRDLRRAQKGNQVLGEYAASVSRVNFVWLGGGLALVLLLALAAYLFSTTPDASSDLAEANSVVEEIEGDSPSDLKEDASVGQTKLDTPAPPSVLQMEALSQVTLVVRLDESAAQEIVLNKGEVKNFDVYRQIEIRNAKKENIKFLYNGKSIEISGPVVKLFNRYLFSE